MLRENSCSCNLYYLPVNKVEVIEDYESEGDEPMFMQMSHHLQSVSFLQSGGKTSKGVCR